MNSRLKQAFQRAFIRTDEARYTYGTVGRLLDGVPVFAVTGRPDYVFVTIRQTNGAQTSPPARNDAGVPHSLGLPVRMRLEGTTYVIDRVARRSDLAYTDPPPPSGIAPHLHDDRYFTESEHISVSAGAGNAGDPIVLDAGGHVDVTMINAADIATKIHAATLDTGPLDADEVPSLDSSASFGLIRTTWTNIKAFFKTYFDTLYVALTGNQIVAGQKSFSDDMYLTDGKFFYMTDPDVAHGMTDLFPTDVFAAYGQSSGTLGGIALYGLSDGNAQAALIRAIIGTSTPTLPPIVFRGSKKDGTGEQALAAGEIVFALDNSSTRLFVIMGNADVGVGITPAAKLHVFQPTLGSNVTRHQSTATNDDPTMDTLQGRVATTNATPATLHTFAIAASNTYLIGAKVIARRTGGASGTAEDGAAYYLMSAYTTKAGVVTLLGVLENIAVEDVAGWACAFVISGTDVIVQVTGAATTNITWHLVEGEVAKVGT